MQQVLVHTINHFGKVNADIQSLHKQNYITIAKSTSTRLIPANQLNQWTSYGWKREDKNSLIPKGYKNSH